MAWLAETIYKIYNECDLLAYYSHPSLNNLAIHTNLNHNRICMLIKKLIFRITLICVKLTAKT